MGSVSGNVLLLNLPDALARALEEQFPAQNPRFHIENNPRRAIEPGAFDLVIYDPQQTPPASLPKIQLGLAIKGQIRLGVLMRQILQALEAPSLHMDDFSIGPFIFSPADRLLQGQGGETTLTDKECDILCCLARHAPRPVQKDFLLKNIWHYQDGVDTHTLETHIYRLRQKIEDAADNPVFLLTDAGGYKLAGV